MASAADERSPQRLPMKFRRRESGFPSFVPQGGTPQGSP